MKVFHQSISVPAGPFVHLGYVAATVTRPDAALQQAILVSAVLAIVLAVGAVGGWVLSLARYRYRIAAGVALVGAVLLVVLAVSLDRESRRKGTTEYAHPETITRYWLLSAAMVLDGRLRRGESVPEDAEALRGAAGIPAFDGWRRPIRVDRDGGGRIEMASAGADGSFGTADDLRMVLEGGREGKRSGPGPGR